ncbi:MAG: hypothetical protein LC798_02935 [Chloroflexi bacterium]|nr:hypothetical protein [Chloroflexota bacterium]
MYVLDEYHDLIDESRDCAICGDKFEVGDKAVWVPAGYGPKNAIVPVHLHCAVKGDEIDLTVTELHDHAGTASRHEYQSFCSCGWASPWMESPGLADTSRRGHRLIIEVGVEAAGESCALQEV